jgi:hypothetical protein
MPAQVPAIDTHPQRDKILEALLNNESPQSIAKWINPPINHTSIWRYRRNRIEPKLKQAAETAKTLQQNALLAARASVAVPDDVIRDAAYASVAADPIMSRVLAKYQRYDDMYAKTVDPQGFSSIDRAETQALTLHANLTGRLQQAGPSTVVQIVFGQFPQNPNENACNRDATDCTDVAPGDVIDISPVR